MKESLNKFYARGKVFYDQEDFLQFCYDWPDLQFDLEDFKREMEMRIKEAELNNHIRHGQMTNREAYRILRLCTDWAVQGEDHGTE